jgi:hypothetical protein
MLNRLIAVFFLLSSGLAFGQAITEVPVTKDNNNRPATTYVTICSTNPGGGTCGSTVTTYTSATLATACSGTGVALNNTANASAGSGCSNPGYSDQNGNILAFTAAGTYYCQIGNPNSVKFSIPCPSNGTGGGSGTVTSVTGTANQVAVATGTTTPVLSIPATFIAPGTISAATSIDATKLLGNLPALNGSALTNITVPTGVGINTGVFYISNNCSTLPTSQCLPLVDDDSTDNCGAALTAFMASVNAYAGPGVPSVIIQGSGVGKAYKFATTNCHLAFLIPTHVQGPATFDCAQTGTNCIQLGPTGLSGLTGAQAQMYSVHDLTFVGGASLTVAGIEQEPYISNADITHNRFTNFGATNATAGSCTNFAFQMDQNAAESTVSYNEWVVTDSTTNRCGFNNPLGFAAGTNTMFFLGNTLGGFGSSSNCSSQGVVDGGSYGLTRDNNIYGFGVPIRLQGVGHTLVGNRIDTAGCTANGINANIHFGQSGVASAVTGVTIKDSVGPIVGAGSHTRYLLNQAGDSTSSTIVNAVLISNISSNGSNGDLFPGTMNCTVNDSGGHNGCYEYGNINIASHVPCGISGAGDLGTGWQLENIYANCNFGGKTANLTGTQATLFTPGLSKAINVSCEILLTTAATTSSTLPTCSVVYTDLFTNTTQTVAITPTWATGTLGCSGTVTNTVGNSCKGVVPITPKPTTAVNIVTGSYASVGGTAMQYTAWVNATAQ